MKLVKMEAIVMSAVVLKQEVTVTWGRCSRGSGKSSQGKCGK